MQKEKNPMKINKITIILIVLVVWAVFSAVYMMNDYWQEFKMNRLQVAYNSGSSQAVSQIIEKAKTCEPVNLYAKDKKVNLIDVACLQQGGGQQAASQEEAARENSGSEE